MNKKGYDHDEKTYNNNEPQNNNGDVPYKTLDEALELVKNAVQGEWEDEMFYDYLISVAPSQEEKEIITTIRNDEIKHNKMFREIYAYFTGEQLPKSSHVNFKEPKSYLDGIKKAFFGELSAMERYRIIRAGLPSEYYRDMVFEILTDEMKHADKYNYIMNMHSDHMEDTDDMNHMKSMQTNSRETSDEEDRNELQENMPQDLLEYISPLVNQALKEADAGVDLEYLFQKYILIGILIGNGFTAEQGVEQVKAWENRI